jgi:hypothetical protein
LDFVKGAMDDMLKNVKISAVLFLILMAGFFLIPARGNSQLSFTYTSPVTQKAGVLDSLTGFTSALTNTGSVADTYDVDLIRKSQRNLLGFDHHSCAHPGFSCSV